MTNWIAYFATVLGLALVVTGWFLWGDQSQTNIFALNIAISVIAYVVMFIDVLLPWGNFREKTQRRIGNLAMRWFVQYGYSITAIALLIICNLANLQFEVSIFLQCGLLLLLIFGIAAAKGSGEKIEEVSRAISHTIDCLQLVRQAQDSLLEAAYDASAPDEVVEKIKRLGEDLRFVTPSNSDESRKVESQIMELFDQTRSLLSSYELNNELINNNIEKGARLIQKRKSTYSN
ncbi:MAG: hypothetical protein IKY56_06075 [Alistipes sp.]|nr:hypothetical protein [Alistipes sp.]